MKMIGIWLKCIACFFCFIWYFTTAFNLEPYKSPYQLYFLNNSNNLLVQNIFFTLWLIAEVVPYHWLKQKADFHQYLNFSYHVLGCIVSEQNENWVILNVITFLIPESHVSEINHLAATHWFPEVEIHSIMQLAQPLYYVTRQLILSRYASKYRNASIDIHNVSLVPIGVPDSIYWMWSVFTIPWYCGNTAK